MVPRVRSINQPSPATRDELTSDIPYEYPEQRCEEHFLVDIDLPAESDAGTEDLEDILRDDVESNSDDEWEAFCASYYSPQDNCSAPLPFNSYRTEDDVAECLQNMEPEVTLRGRRGQHPRTSKSCIGNS